MTNFLITPLTPGTTDDELKQFLNRSQRPFLVSSKIDEISGFMDNFEGSSAIGSAKEFGPVNTETSSLLPKMPVVVDGSAMISDFPILLRRPLPLNATDLLMENCNDPSSIMFGTSGIDSIVKEEQDEANPLFSENPPHPQMNAFVGPNKDTEILVKAELEEAYPLFSQNPPYLQKEFFEVTPAETLMEEEDVDEFRRHIAGAVENVVKEEEMADDYGYFKGVEEQGEEKESVEMRQDLPLALQGDVPPDDCASFECEICNFVFSMQHDLLRHWKAHPKCVECGRRFPVKRLLTEHRRLEHIECDICGMRLSTWGVLKSHKMIHTGELPYECQVCKMRFRRKFQHDVHMRMHTGEKTFECEVCKKHFNQKCNMKVHMLTHTGERPHKCPECQKTFTQSSSLLSHRRSIHGFQKS